MSTDTDAILAAIETIRSTNSDSHNDIRELIREGLKGVQLNINANAEITNKELEDINKHFTQLNGSVAELHVESEKRKQALIDFRDHEREHQKRWDWCKKNWWIVFILCLLGMALFIGIYDAIGIRTLLAIVFERI